VVDPVGHVSEWLGGEAVAAVAPFPTLLDKAGMAQHAEVLADRRLADGERRHQLR
jgi:hypothetical protein